MNRKLLFVAVLIVCIQAVFIIAAFPEKLPATATENAKPKFLKKLGLHMEGENSLFGVYCDVERGNLIYSYVVSTNNTTSNLVVIKDGCKGEK